MRCSRPQAAFPSRSFFPQKKRRHLRASHQSGSPRSCAPRVCFSKLKKGTEAEGRACSHTRVQSPFSTNCRDKNAANFQYKTQVLWYFLDARKYRPPASPPSSYSCFTQLRRRRIFFSPSNQFHSARISWLLSRFGPVSATSMPASRATLSISQMSSALAPELR